MNANATSDPVRLLPLLWRARLPEPSVRRGPRARISVDTLVRTAIGIADREGIDAVTVRAVAAACGVSPMTVYSHVPDKDALLDLMTDQVLVDMTARPLDDPDWRVRLRVLADDNFAGYRAHPWLVSRHSERPAMGPGLVDKYERELAAFTGLGLSAVDTDSALSFLLDFVRTAAGDAEAAQRDGGTSGNAEWWRSIGPELAELLDPKNYPLSTYIGREAGEILQGAHNAAHAYRFGLDRILDGIGALIAASGH